MYVKVQGLKITKIRGQKLKVQDESQRSKLKIRAQNSKVNDKGQRPNVRGQ